MRGQGIPAGLCVAGPNPSAKARGAGKAITMETPGAEVRALQQRTFVIAPMPSQTRLDRQFIAVIRPPAIHAQGEDLAMARPVVVDVKRGIGVLSDGGANKMGWRGADVEGDFEIE